jgi:hypothetical protein
VLLRAKVLPGLTGEATPPLAGTWKEGQSACQSVSALGPYIKCSGY